MNPRDRILMRSSAVLMLLSGTAFLVGPALPYVHYPGLPVTELAALTWPNPIFVLGLALVIAAAGATVLRARSSSLRSWACGVAVVPLATVLVIHFVRILQLHFVNHVTGSDLGVGGLLLVVAIPVGIGAACVAAHLSARPEAHRTQLDAGAPWLALLMTGAILQEWFVAPIAATGDGFTLSGSSVRITDVYGWLVYITTGAVAPQAVAACGVAAVVALVASAAPFRGPAASGITAGGAVVAGVDTLARLVEMVHVGKGMAVRGLPLIATGLTALLLLGVAVAQASLPSGRFVALAEVPDA